MPDTKVNTDADANGSVVEAIVSINGGQVVIWDDAGDIVSQRYDSSGAPVGGVTTVNTVTDGRQSGVVASGLPNAGYVVVWASPAAEGGGNELRGRVYDENGAATGPQFSLTEDANTSSGIASISGLADGNFAMVWRASNGSTSVDYVGRFTPQGVMLEADTLPTGSGAPNNSVAGLAGGGYVLLGADTGPVDQGATLRVTRFGADGVQQGSPVLVNPDHLLGPSLRIARVSGLEGGGFVATWVSSDQADAEVYMRQYDASGAPVTAEIHVNTSTYSAQYAPHVTALSDGGYFITWIGYLQTSNSLGLGPAVGHGYGQRYDESGARIGSEISISEDMTLNQYNVMGVGLEDGHGAFTWRSRPGSSGVTDVYQTLVDIIDGTPNADTLTGSALRDFIYGYGGNDTLDGGGGADILEGGAGNDTLNGGAGDDVIDGGPGDDAITGGGADTADTVSYASAAAGVIVDLATGTATGGGGSDTLTGIRNIIGSAFGDTLTSIGYGGVLRGMGGDDVFHFSGWAVDAAPATTFDGGEGVDMVSFAEASGPVTANLAFSSISAYTPSGWYHEGNIVSIEGFSGSGYGDTLRGDAGANVLKGWDGNDNLYGEDGNDFLAGEEVDDILNGGAGNDLLSGGEGTDILYGLEGNDTLVGGGGTAGAPDYFYGGAGNDHYYVNSSLTSPLDLVFEGALFAGSEAGVGDIDHIHSTGQFFWDYYSVGEYLHISTAIEGGAYLIGGKDVANKSILGSSGTDYISTYGGDARVDAGAGTDAISFDLYGLDESYRGSNTVVMKAGSGTDYVHAFRSGVDHIDLTAFNFGITGQQVLDQAVNVDNAGTDNDYSYFYLTSAGGVDNFVIFVGLLSNQLQASDFIT